jgi:RNA-directed DNA polymerase
MLGTEVSVMNAEANGMEPVSKTQELCEKLYLAAKKSKTRRFHALYDKVYRMDFLVEAWAQVKRNRGKPGVDDESIDDIKEKGEEVVLQEIQKALKEKGRYRPRKVKRVNIPKPDGSTRPLGIPTVRDRIVQASTKRVIEPVFEADFLDCNYGFRPSRSAHAAVEEVRRWMNRGHEWVLDADIKGFFDNIDHEKLLEFVHQRINDRRVLKLIRKWLKCGVMDAGVPKESITGTPQGGVISPLLANIYLHEFDKFWTEQTRVEGKLVRYADDFVILFRTERDAAIGLHLVKLKLRELGLELNEAKTQIINTHGGNGGFDFLGFHHRKVMSPKYKKHYAQKWPSTKAMKAIRSEIRAFLGRRAILNRSIEDVIRDLNPVLRGWMNYFRYGNSAGKFAQIDRYVHERLALWWSKKRGKHVRRWGTYFIWKEYRDCGVQRLCGNVRLWSCESKG